MTVISSSAISPIHEGTGLENTYPFPFIIFNESELIVVERDLSNFETILVLSDDYSITGVGNSNGGNVILTSNLSQGHKLVAFRKKERVQEINLTNQQCNFFGLLEKGLDISTMLIQELQIDIDRSLKKSVTSGEEVVDVDAFISEMNQNINESNAALLAAESAEVGAETSQSAAEAAMANAITAKNSAEKIISDLEALSRKFFKISYALDTADIIQSFSIRDHSENALGFSWSSDGLKMFIVTTIDEVQEYSLSKAWDVSTASFHQSMAVTVDPRSFTMKPDGTKMYIVDSAKKANEYTLSTPWDISTAVFIKDADVSNKAIYTPGIVFSSDGTNMFILIVPGGVTQYSLSIPWDIGTAVYLQYIYIYTQELNVKGFDFSEDGTKMYVTGTDSFAVLEYVLSTAWDISTASFNQSFDLSTTVYIAGGVKFGKKGMKMYILDSTHDDVWEFSTGKCVFG